MNVIVTEREMRRHEEYTCQKCQCSTTQLIEKAGASLYRDFLRYKQEEMFKSRLLVLVGPGNNGSDALVFSRLAFEDGWKLTLLMVDPNRDWPSSAKDCQSQLALDALFSLESIPDLPSFIAPFTIIVDGLFGVGINRPITGKLKELIEVINRQSAFVYALDIPSGIHADTGQVLGSALKANVTGALQYRKLGHLLSDGMDYTNELNVLDLDFLFAEGEPLRQYLDFSDFLAGYKPRKRRSHKYDYGNILVIGGSPGMMGAPEIAAMSALRSGAGLVKVAVYAPDIPYVQPVFPEVMHTFYGSVEELNLAIAQSDVILFGPGLGRHHPLATALLKKLLEMKKPLVVDADGLAYLKNELANLKNPVELILTPHPGELKALLDQDLVDQQKTPEKQVESLSALGATVVLKAHWTLIATNSDSLYMTGGNPGMATAGSGDVLSGIIATFLAQEKRGGLAASKGVLLFQEAGRLAAADHQEESMIASDIIAKISEVFRKCHDKLNLSLNEKARR
ncbi:MAG: NAD(P)H-hydrate dehydratase [Candidatus Izemoplasmatales bacterium]